MDMLSFIQSHGFSFTPENLDETMHEIRCSSTSRKLWYVGSHKDGKYSLTFGAFDTGEKYSFRDKNLKRLSKEERALLNKKKLEQHEYASTTAIELLKRAEFGDSGSTYLAKKCLPDVVSFVRDHLGLPKLLVPMSDALGRVWNLQFIQSSGQKSNLPKARSRGLAYTFEAPSSTITIICEGFATAHAVHLATNYRTMAAFGLANIPHVLKEFKHLKNVVVCVDNDFEATTNAGHLMREKLQKSFGGLRFLSPKNVLPGESDYSDLYIRGGKDLVLKDINEQLELNMTTLEQTPTTNIATHVRTYVNGVQPMPTRYSAKGEELLPLESEVAHHILQYYGDSIVKSNGDIFLFHRTHWAAMTENEESNLISQIMVAHNGKGSARRYQNIRQLVYSLAPSTNLNLFAPNPYAANFKNGTLHLVEKDKRWGFDFKPHSKADLMTTLIDINYDPTRLEKNPNFDAWVNKLLGGNAQKIRMLKQMYGACLVPLFPRFFLLYGPSGYGKSSLILGAMNLVCEQNVATVGPGEMAGFELEGLIGKLINVDTDVDLDLALKDSLLKKIVDRIPLQINRKGRPVIRAPLPSVHLYGANALPRTLEKSDANSRRWSLLHVNSCYVAGDDTEQDFVSRLVAENPQAVLNFALEGLEDLLSSKGQYFDSDESKEGKRVWKLESDVVGRFLADVAELGTQNLVLGKELSISMADLWVKFKAWHNQEEGSDPRISLNSLSRSLVTRGFEKKRMASGRIFWGLGMKELQKKTEMQKQQLLRDDAANALLI